MNYNKRFVKTIKNYISHFNLNLKGSRVLTEAASDYYACTPLLAAAAGAEVDAVAKDSPYGKASNNIEYIINMAKELEIESNINFISDPDEADLSSINIITNLGFVRPITAGIINKLSQGTTVSLMCEAWEARPCDIDISACFDSNISVVGINEDHKDVDVFDFVGPLLIKMLFGLNIEIFKNFILIVGDDKFAERTYKFLRLCGATVKRASNETWRDNLSDELDAVVFADYTFKNKYIGSGGMISSVSFAERCPSTSVCILCGSVDVDELCSQDIRCLPNKNTEAYRMGKTFDFLGMKPVIILHTAGLKVAEISWKTWDASKTRPENEQTIYEASNSMADHVDWPHYIPELKRQEMLLVEDM